MYWWFQVFCSNTCYLFQSLHPFPSKCQHVSILAKTPQPPSEHADVKLECSLNVMRGLFLLGCVDCWRLPSCAKCAGGCWKWGRDCYSFLGLIVHYFVDNHQVHVSLYTNNSGFNHTILFFHKFLFLNFSQKYFHLLCSYFYQMLRGVCVIKKCHKKWKQAGAEL